MAFSDQELTCIDCQAPFDFTAGEAQFFQDRGLSIPRRCKECRAKKKLRNKQPEPVITHQEETDDELLDGGLL